MPDLPIIVRKLRLGEEIELASDVAEYRKTHRFVSTEKAFAVRHFSFDTQAQITYRSSRWKRVQGVRGSSKPENP